MLHMLWHSLRELRSFLKRLALRLAPPARRKKKLVTAPKLPNPPLSGFKRMNERTNGQARGESQATDRGFMERSHGGYSEVPHAITADHRGAEGLQG